MKMKTKLGKIMEKDLQQAMTTKPDGQNSLKWQRLQQEVTAMRERYGEATDFLALFTPALQTFAAREWEKAYTGTAPSLAAIVQGYNEETAIVWLCLQLEDINLFAGVKEKMPVARQKELARLILTEYSHLKASEFLLFFHRLKCGRYGRFYGSVDALFISSSLLQFMDERRRDRATLAERREREEKQISSSSTGITYAEYLERKKQREGGNDEPK